MYVNTYIVRSTLGTWTTYLGIILGLRLTGDLDLLDEAGDPDFRGDLDLFLFSFSSIPSLSFSSDFLRSRLSLSSLRLVLSRSRSLSKLLPPDLFLSPLLARPNSDSNLTQKHGSQKNEFEEKIKNLVLFNFAHMQIYLNIILEDVASFIQILISKYYHPLAYWNCIPRTITTAYVIRLSFF